MRTGPVSILPALLPAALLLAGAPAEARPHPGRHHHRTAQSDMDRTLARMAAGDRLLIWRAGPVRRPLALSVPPATRERVAAPPFTGWGYGGTIPGASPGF
ncbi:hypothetical protein [Methylobacterium sp. NEAU K]|uniref:hypothetical protein n=1 Tax=Methylobacterium sp. NEAU K TaxID=3064946 RepID=UPI00273504D5|nr:hypothetical protein [Methylobacterium sp. NEAU K]MDP4005543.1 hypothetical protein [Methylobacterium sp. NEAU K]